MKKRIISLCLLLPLTVFHMAVTPVAAEPFTAEEQQILEQSLSIQEIDREIERIESRQLETEEALRVLQGQLSDKNEQIRVSRGRLEAARLLYGGTGKFAVRFA